MCPFSLWAREQCWALGSGNEPCLFCSELALLLHKPLVEFMRKTVEFYKICLPSRLIALSYDQKGAMATICSVNLCQSEIFVAAIFALNHCRFRLSEEFSYWGFDVALHPAVELQTWPHRQFSNAFHGSTTMEEYRKVNEKSTNQKEHKTPIIIIPMCLLYFSLYIFFIIFHHFSSCSSFFILFHRFSSWAHGYDRIKCVLFRRIGLWGLNQRWTSPYHHLWLSLSCGGNSAGHLLWSLEKGQGPTSPGCLPGSSEQNVMHLALFFGGVKVSYDCIT